MPLPKTVAVIAISLCMIKASAQTTSANPLLIHSNAPIEFNKITAPLIREAVSSIIALSDARIKKISAVAASEHTLSNTLMAMDELNYDLTDLGSKLSLISSTFSDDSTRNCATEQLEKLGLYGSNLSLNEDLYKALKQYQSSAAAKSLEVDQQKFLRETILAFELTGMKLDSAGRKNLAAINEKLIDFGSDFDRNIAESKDSVSFTLADLKGLPDATMAPWKRADGNYVVYVNGPNEINILTYAEKDATRHTMYIHYNNRAYPKNIQALDSLFFDRQQFATALGFKSYADYALVTKMAANPTNVWNFENDLITKLKPHATIELKELSDLKHASHPELSDTIQAWDFLFYQEKLLDTKYNVNTDEVKQYFEINHTVEGMFHVYEKLFNIQIKQTHDAPVWSPKVTSYEMFKDGQKIGIFYLDLYPRPNKYTHFETAPISAYRIADGKEVLPVSTLICNFPESTPEQPSLLDHQDVVTMFHEFGHLVHSLLGHPRIASQSSFAVKPDFVEAPSQFLENFCWEYEPLKMLARNYKTGAVMPKELFDRLKKTQHVLGAISYIRQVYLGVLDFTYENKYDSIKNRSIIDVFKDVFAIQQIPFPEGSHFICSFGHLNGYGANYYGYLWSLVFAQDLFSEFQKNGVMDVSTGIRYRKDILEKAATMQEMDMMRNFLGREPNNAAFLASLGIK
jgi:thimet oligopeptidase